MKLRDTSKIWPFSLFGGAKGTAEALGKAPTTIQYWVTQKRIPQAQWDEMIAAADKIGIKITPSELHNMEPIEAAPAVAS